MLTPKPQVTDNNPPTPVPPKTRPATPHRPYNTKHQASSPSHTLKPQNPTKPLSSFSDFIPTPQHPTATNVLIGYQWPVGGRPTPENVYVKKKIMYLSLVLEIILLSC